MARKKKEDINSDSLKARLTDSNAKDMPAIDQPITEMLEINYMPYAMSVIVSRAIPEIDGFKPSHRKLLYTMYKMGLLGGNRTKSANVVGQTMKLTRLSTIRWSDLPEATVHCCIRLLIQRVTLVSSIPETCSAQHPVIPR